MPTNIRNPGPWSFAIFALACALVAFLYYIKAPDAVKLGGQLLGVAIAAFGAKNALATKGAPDTGARTRGSDPPKPKPRERMNTWPDDENGGIR